MTKAECVRAQGRRSAAALQRVNSPAACQRYETNRAGQAPPLRAREECCGLPATKRKRQQGYRTPRGKRTASESRPYFAGAAAGAISATLFLRMESLSATTSFERTSRHFAS